MKNGTKRLAISHRVQPNLGSVSFVPLLPCDSLSIFLWCIYNKKKKKRNKEKEKEKEIKQYEFIISKKIILRAC
jgi:hypothetical protein